MTLAEIKAMFIVGQVWTGKRSPGFDGDAHTTTRREVAEIKGNAVIFMVHDKRFWSYWPKAREIIEARPGYVRYSIPKVKAEVELTLQSSS